MTAHRPQPCSAQLQGGPSASTILIVEQGPLRRVGVEADGGEADAVVEGMLRAVVDLVGEDREGDAAGVGGAGSAAAVDAVGALRR